MVDRRSLEQTLFDIEADIRVLILVNQAQPFMSGWEAYGLPREEGYDLMKIPCHDSLATLAAMHRLKASVERALHVFHSE